MSDDPFLILWERGLAGARPPSFHIDEGPPRLGWTP